MSAAGRLKECYTVQDRDTEVVEGKWGRGIPLPQADCSGVWRASPSGTGTERRPKLDAVHVSLKIWLRESRFFRTALKSGMELHVESSMSIVLERHNLGRVCRVIALPALYRRS